MQRSAGELGGHWEQLKCVLNPYDFIEFIGRQLRLVYCWKIIFYEANGVKMFARGRNSNPYTIFSWWYNYTELTNSLREMLQHQPMKVFQQKEKTLRC